MNTLTQIKASSTKPFKKQKSRSLNRMPYHLELGSSGHTFPKGKAIVVNSLTGKHYSKNPLPLSTAKAQLRLLESKAKQESK